MKLLNDINFVWNAEKYRSTHLSSLRHIHSSSTRCYCILLTIDSIRTYLEYPPSGILQFLKIKIDWSLWAGQDRPTCSMAIRYSQNKNLCCCAPRLASWSRIILQVEPIKCRRIVGNIIIWFCLGIRIRIRIHYYLAIQKQPGASSLSKQKL